MSGATTGSFLRIVRILHVEDSFADAALVAAQLEASSYGGMLDLVHAETRELGLEEMLTDDFDIHLVDHGLGARGGLDLIARATASGITAPSILLSGNEDPDVDAAALASGAADFFPKAALSPRALARCIRYNLERSRLKQRIRERSVALEATGLVTFDANQRTLFQNETATELLAAVSMSPSFLLARLDGEEEEVVAGERTLRLRRAEGRWDGRRATLLWITDATEDARAAEHRVQLGKAEVLTRIAGGVAHDFNNLLGGILGHLELARMPGALPSSIDHHIKEALRTAERAAAVTSRLLALSRKQQSERRSFDVHDLLEALMPVMKRLLGDRGSITLGGDAGPVWVLGDAAELEQIVLNLVGNAADAIADGGTFVRLRIDDDDPVRLSVLDDGPGMADDVAGAAFDPFFTTKPVGEGTGLGLSIVREGVEGMGGTIELHSRVGEGTRVELRLPVGEAKDGSSSDTLRDTFAPDGDRVGTLLIVDDEAPIRSVLQAALGSAGYRVRTAASAREALRICAADPIPPDLIVTDIAMPEMDGIELAEQVRIRHPSVPVLFMSGYGEGVLARHGLEEGSVRLVAKPFRLAEVLECIEEALEGRSDGEPLAGADGG